MRKLSDNELAVLKDFGDVMRPLRQQSLQHMAAAKRKLVAGGASPDEASDMLNAVFKQIGDEAEYVRES